ncbi:MAG: chorismate mutase [Alphaproteobacteria bacterium GM7ARS4]|nr:chorismate mutase [Alphaproteobacteria bacterium GM7ARS4]
MTDIKRCRHLGEVRQHIDRLDKALLALLAERTHYVRQAVTFKDRSQIVDEERIASIIARMRMDAKAQGVDEDMVEGLWRKMIDDFIALEYKLFDGKKDSQEDRM